MAGITTIQDKLGELEAGASLADILGGDDLAETWVDDLNQLAIATGMTVDEMNGLLSEIGLTANVETTDVKQTNSIPTTIERARQVGFYDYTVTRPGSNGEDDITTTYQRPLIETWTEEGSPVKVEQTIQVP